MNLIIIQFLTFFYSVLCLDINSPQLRTFPYIENAVGVHNLTLTQRTPPTVHTTTLYILLNKGKEDQTTIGNGCPDNSSICVITTVNLNKVEDAIITGIFSVDEKYTSIDLSSDGILIYWGEQAWGDLDVSVGLYMRCLNDDSSDTESLEWVWGLGSGGLIDDKNLILWKSKSFCNGTANDGGVEKGRSDNKNDNSWGFFSTLFLVLIIVLVGYLIVQAWLKKSIIGSSSDTFNKLMDTIVKNFRKLPQFIGEVIQKISGSNINRGGYSAV